MSGTPTPRPAAPTSTKTVEAEEGGKEAPRTRTPPEDSDSTSVDRLSLRLRVLLVLSLSLTLLLAATQPAAAQVGDAFCTSDLAQTIKNLFTVIQFGGPLIGGVIALGAIVATPSIRRADLKREVKEVRNQAIIWGIIVAPLATTIIAFILNNIVSGGSSCTF